MAVDNEYLEHHLGSLMTTAGTDLGDVTAVAPEVVKRARRRIDVDLGKCPPSRHHRCAWRWQIYLY